MEIILHILFITENVFVPLLRAEDNCTPPLIGKPWSPGVDSCSPLDSHQSCSPKDPTYKVRALAGPMSPSKVWELFHLSFISGFLDF